MGEVYSLALFALFFDLRALVCCLSILEFVVDNWSCRGRLDHYIVLVVFIDAYTHRFLLRVKILLMLIIVIKRVLTNDGFSSNSVVLV